MLRIDHLFPKSINYDTSPAPGLSCKPVKTPAPQNCAIRGPFSPVLPALAKTATSCIEFIVLGLSREELLQLCLWGFFFFSFAFFWVLS